MESNAKWPIIWPSCARRSSPVATIRKLWNHHCRVPPPGTGRGNSCSDPAPQPSGDRMRLTKQTLLMCIVMACALAAMAQSNDAPNRIATLEASVAAGSATHAQQLELARLYADVGRYYEAKKLSDRLIAADANDSGAIAIRDRAAQQLDLTSRQRVEDAEAAAKREGATAADRQELADAYFAAGRYRDAARSE